MRTTNTVIIGGGQAGLAMSRCLRNLDIDHDVLERGQVGERWSSERWDSLRLLTPRSLSHLPGLRSAGDPSGFMTKSEVVRYLNEFARANAAPVYAGVNVSEVLRVEDGYRITTNRGTWRAMNVVIATGQCDQPKVPAFAGSLSSEIAQLTPDRYRNPSQLRKGGVLVVGASATGVQLADEICRSGRTVTLAVGRHIRLPRVYRGRDILEWLATIGVLSERAEQVPDLQASRRQPSVQLVGAEDRRSADLAALQAQGVKLTGSMIAASETEASFAEDLRDWLAKAQDKMHRQLDRVDEYISECGLEGRYPAEERPPAITAPPAPARLELQRAGIQTVLWATGYRRDYSWLRVPVLDGAGELIHDGGITPAPGLYALGLNFMRRRDSSFLSGVGRDATELAEQIRRRCASSRQLIAY